MAKDPSFDIVSEIDTQEIDNAVNQAKKELENRYDLKGSGTEIVTGEKYAYLEITTDNEFSLKSVIDILQSKFVKRNLPLKSMNYQKVEPAASSRVRQKINIVQGIAADKGKEIIKDIKTTKIKVQSSLDGDKVRVTGKKIDDLQEVIRLVKEKDYGIALQFSNYR